MKDTSVQIGWRIKKLSQKLRKVSSPHSIYRNWDFYTIVVFSTANIHSHFNVAVESVLFSNLATHDFTKYRRQAEETRQLGFEVDRGVKWTNCSKEWHFHWLNDKTDKQLSIRNCLCKSRDWCWYVNRRTEAEKKTQASFNVIIILFLWVTAARAVTLNFDWISFRTWTMINDVAYRVMLHSKRSCLRLTRKFIHPLHRYWLCLTLRYKVSDWPG